MAFIAKRIMIDAPAEMVYAFAHDPHHWADWYVGLSGPEHLNGEGETGTVGEFTYTMAGIHFPLAITVAQDGPMEDGFVCKTEVAGPLAGHQVVTFFPKGERTEVAVGIDYTVPGKALGRVADTLLLERMEGQALEHTLTNLKELIEARVPVPVAA